MATASFSLAHSGGNVRSSLRPGRGAALQGTAIGSGTRVRLTRVVPWAACLMLYVACAMAAGERPLHKPTLSIPRVDKAPTLEDFEQMKPSPEWEGKLAKVENFLQGNPKEGEPATERTEVYLGYDDKHLYAVFVAFDSEPHKLRARMVSRENFVDETATMTDDGVSISLDTFNDKRRGYVFQINPFGIQWDGLYSDSKGFDASFDTVWYSRGKVTDRGFVVWVAIPFKSLRFPSTPEQTWGILLNRDIPRKNETDFWPDYSNNVAGFINQGTTLTGLQDISPGRNLQFIPYGAFRSFRALDTRDPAAPRFATRDAEFNGGLDAKIVLEDSLVLDFTANPDFGQVESDEPQVTVNERFEVFFPEKRPFFLENSSFFQTPINLVFTRRIADPQFGARVTGKLGRWALGAMVVDDESPGKSVPENDPRSGRRALFGIVRVNRDILKESSIGFIFTDRELDCGSSCPGGREFNRVGGVDGRFRVRRSWTASFQAVTSATQLRDGTSLAGPAYEFKLNRRGRQFNYSLSYRDRSPGFEALAGFIPRKDIREFYHSGTYRFRPAGKRLLAWGPELETGYIWDHSGQRLNSSVATALAFELVGRTNFGFWYQLENELLRPQDFQGLPGNRDFHRANRGFWFGTSYWRRWNLEGEVVWGQRINLAPPAGQEPALANRLNLEALLTVRPTTRLRIDNSYLLFRLTDRANGASIMNNHILRSKWNYQFTRELSLRMILQYDALLAHTGNSSLETRKNFNADILLTYLFHPGTAFYVGYNSNLQNIDLVHCAPGTGCSTQLVRTNRFLNDAKGFFLKATYLFSL